MKYCDEILQPPIHLSIYIKEGKLKILEIYSKSGKNPQLLSHIFVHLQNCIDIDTLIRISA